MVLPFAMNRQGIDKRLRTHPNVLRDCAEISSKLAVTSYAREWVQP
jgi:hypothetical protein